MNINTSSNDVDDLVSFIIPGARKIFAILLLIGFQSGQLQRAIRLLQRDQIGDDFLPITDENRDKVPFFINREGPWESKVAERNFRRYQWAFLTPELPPQEADGPILSLHVNAILPIIEAKPIDTGAFGTVYKALPSESNIRLPKLKVSLYAQV